MFQQKTSKSTLTLTASKPLYYLETTLKKTSDVTWKKLMLFMYRKVNCMLQVEEATLTAKQLFSRVY